MGEYSSNALETTSYRVGINIAFGPFLVKRTNTEDTVAQECRLKFIDKEIFKIESPPGNSF